MATPQDVRRIAMALPGAEDASTPTRLAFEVGGKGYAWSWLEREAPKGPRKPRLDVLAVRCLREEKDILMALLDEAYVDDPHYGGFPAVVFRLEAVDEARLEHLLVGGWRCMAKKAAVKAYDAARAGG